MVFSDKFHLWIFLLIIRETSGVSYNQPKFNSSSSWNSNGTTVANSTLIGTYPYDIFINTNNTIFVPNQETGQILIFFKGNITSFRNISGNFSNSSSLFVTTTDDIYADTFHSMGGVSQILSNSTTINIPRLKLCQQCWDLFVSINDTLYCSLSDRHQVLAKSLDGSNQLTAVAGTGSAGSTSTMLRNPHGIFVDTNSSLYVADCGNDRIQFFPSQKLTATTIVGNGLLIMNVTLNCPTGIILDDDQYLYIVDSGNHRIVGQGSNGFQCLVGCSGSPGAATNQLNQPWSISFDSYGNLFVSDHGNSRIQQCELSTNLGVWTMTGNMSVARSEHTASILSNGTVLVSGGFDDSDILNSAELY